MTEGREGDVRGCAVAVMAKASSPGRTKTRLVPPLTHAEAAACNTAFVSDVVANVETADPAGRLQVAIASGPGEGAAFFHREIGPSLRCFDAIFPSFGLCLAHAMQHGLADGLGSAAVLNSDSPTLPAAYLVEMVDALAMPGDRAVLGPSTDGGYYVLALKTMHTAMFEAIDWSTDRVAAQTLDRARSISLPVHCLPIWYDVDDAASLRSLHGELFEDRRFAAEARPSAASATRRLLQHFCADPAFTHRLGLDAALAGA